MTCHLAEQTHTLSNSLVFFLPLLFNFLKELISQEDTQDSPPNKHKWKRRNVTIHSRSQKATREKPSTPKASALHSTKAATSQPCSSAAVSPARALSTAQRLPIDSQTDGPSAVCGKMGFGARKMRVHFSCTISHFCDFREMT